MLLTPSGFGTPVFVEFHQLQFVKEEAPVEEVRGHTCLHVHQNRLKAVRRSNKKNFVKIRRLSLEEIHLF